MSDSSGRRSPIPRTPWTELGRFLRLHRITSSDRRHRALVYGGATLLLCILALLGFLLARDNSVAKLTSVSGHPERDFAAAQLKWSSASVGDSFFGGDGARTSAEDSAEFVLRTGAQLRLSPSAQIRFGRRRGRGAIGLTVDWGQVDLITKEGRLTLDSQFGEIIFDTNSKVVLSRSGNRLAIDVQLGHIQLTKEGSSSADYNQGAHVEMELGGVVLEPERPPASAPTPSSEEPSVDDPAQPDVTIAAGENVTVHDPRPATLVGIRSPSECPLGVAVTSGSRSSSGKTRALLKFDVGHHDYVVRCDNWNGKVVARGTIHVVRDAGTRPLPAYTPTASVAADGRTYTVYFQERLPRISLSWPAAPSEKSYTVTIDGVSRRLKSASYLIDSGAMSAGHHEFFFASASSANRRSRSTSIEILRDTVVPLARLSQPKAGNFQRGSVVNFSGQALPGWTVRLHGEPVAQDTQGKFSVDVRVDGPLPFAFSHPKAGIHYYVRRPDAK